MNYFTYIIQSSFNQSYYIGHTNNQDNRLKRHNSGRNKSTRAYRPWYYVYLKRFSSRAEAAKHERYLKSLKSRTQLYKVISDAQKYK